MKRFISIIVSLLVILNVTAICSFASENLVLNPVEFSAEDNSIAVSGIIKNQRDRIPMTLCIEKDGEILGASEAFAVGSTEEGVPFEFSPVKLNASATGGTLNITVSAAYVEWSTSTPYDFFGADNRLEAMEKLEEALATENDTAFVEYIHTYKDALGIDIDRFDDLSDSSEEIAVRNLMTRRYTLPEDYSTPENCELIQKAIRELNQQYKEAMALADFFELDSASELKKWYEANKEQYGLAEDDAETEVDETEMTSYFEDILSTNAYLARRENVKSVISMKELSVLIKHQAILQTIEDSNQYAVRNVLNEFPKLLTRVDYSAWKKLGTTKQNAVCADVAGESYSSIKLFEDAVNDAIDDVLSSTDKGGSSSGGGGGGRGGSNTPVYIGADSSEITTSAMMFTDIDGVPWAESAIFYLHRNGIVSGRTATIFAPDEPVTRAELVKMLVLGLDLKDNANDKKYFNDVSADAWYAEVVNIAATHGLLKGDEKGNFNPDAPISRQDAATILYRAINPDGASKSASFVDYDEIGDYAKTAVDYMYAKGIINGVGDGCFAPNALLSRAQCAKMLHLIMSVL